MTNRKLKILICQFNEVDYYNALLCDDEILSFGKRSLAWLLFVVWFFSCTWFSQRLDSTPGDFAYFPCIFGVHC